MNRELIVKAVALLLSYREYTGDCRIANVCGEIVEALKVELAKPEQKPVGWFAKDWQGTYVELIPEAKYAIPLYAAPPRKE